MQLRSALLPVLLVPFALCAQNTFPTLTGETADGRTISIPSGSNSGFTVVALAFGKGAQNDLEAWYEPAYLRFIAKHGLFASAYSCEVWFVPVFVGVNKAAYDPSMKRFRNSAEPEVVDHVVFFKGEFEEAKAQLGLARADVPYFFVLDADGRILYRTEGAYSDDKLDEMEEVMLQ